MIEKITIIGRSKVGLSLAKAVGARVLAARQEKYPPMDSDVIIISTRDDRIAEVAKRVVQVATERLKVIVHVAGSIPPSVLPKRRGVLRLTLHPIQTFPKPSAESFTGIYWMACSEDAAAIRWARKFVKSLGGKEVIVLPAESLPLYHALTVFSANFVTLLGGAIEEMSKALGQNPKTMKAAVRPLMKRAMENVLSKPAKDVLTGPIQRGDVETIRKHQKALKALDPQLRKLYDAFLEFAEVHVLDGMRPHYGFDYSKAKPNRFSSVNEKVHQKSKLSS